MKLAAGRKEYYDYHPLATVECRGICDGVWRTWKEYVPGSYRPGEEMPLVISLHGGSPIQGRLHTGDRSNAFTHVAEKYGFIMVYAQSLDRNTGWNVWELYDHDYGVEYKNDIVYLDWLIDTICEKYSVNTHRIYIHAHSFGDVMATEYVLKRSHRLAAAALCSGPSNASGFTGPDGAFYFDERSALPVLRTHGSEDLAAPSGKWPHVTENILVRCNPVQSVIEKYGGVTDEARKLKMELSQMPNILLWNRINGWNGEMSFSVRGDLNIVKYEGRQPFYYIFEEGGGHFLPVWSAEYIWKCFFSRHSNKNGKRITLAGDEILNPDPGDMFFAADAEYAYIENRREKLIYRIRSTGSDLLISLKDARRFMGAAPEILVSNQQTEIINGAEYISLTACAKISGLRAVCSRGVVYISINEGSLSYDMTYILKSYLGVSQTMTAKECYELEKSELAKHHLEIPVYPDRVG